MTADDAALYDERDDALLRAERAELREAELEQEVAELRAALKGDLGIFSPRDGAEDVNSERLADVWAESRHQAFADISGDGWIVEVARRNPYRRADR